MRAMRARSRSPTTWLVSMALRSVPHLVLDEHGRLAGLDDVLRAPDRCGGVHGHDLADDEPIEEHPQSGEGLLDRGAALAPRELLLDVGRDVRRSNRPSGSPLLCVQAKNARAARW